MTETKFYDAVLEAVTDRMGEDYQVNLHQITKNNDLELTGISIHTKERNISPTIYLNSFYKEYEEGRDFDDIVDKILSIYEETHSVNDIDLTRFDEYDWVKDRIMMKLCNYSNNRKLLKDVPHKKVLDLALVFYVPVQSNSIGAGSVLVHQSHMEHWGVDVEELYHVAQENLKNTLSPTLSSMEEVMMEFMDHGVARNLLSKEGGFPLPKEEEAADMYVLTNSNRYFGATTLFYDGVMEDVARILQSDFYIIPSSIHEVILVPKGVIPISTEELSEMVMNVNSTEVDQCDILSDHIYSYDRMTKELSCA
ncbi:MAG: DUF5688 family protein [Lachnospiraceae bacterium]|nr:DUF5688 family protein [Lachnospiraceae bacterium]